jgi:anti-anti-sigma factor
MFEPCRDPYFGEAHCQEITLTFEGDFSLKTCARLKDMCLQALILEPRRLVVDLAAVPYVDSAGLGVLVSGLRRAATRAYRRLLELDDERRHLLEIAAREVEELQARVAEWMAWQEREVSKLDRRRADYLANLEGWTRLESERSGKRHVDYPCGRVQLRKQPDEWVYAEEGFDADALLAYAQVTCCTRVEVKAAGILGADLFGFAESKGLPVVERVDKVAIKRAAVLAGGKVCDNNGEIIPGVRVEPRPDKLVYAPTAKE